MLLCMRAILRQVKEHQACTVSLSVNLSPEQQCYRLVAYDA